ncbi:Protoporphyrinogen oxidase [Athelia psychrophila]|uniref:Protoporphyrinogen oxidase n=1 Tax=Athelia psychrophila TaxID=1759441 RepID=A0A166FK47_9AGAM|nr:Protoporphyrinogen oxidase [Fibularhizoctonia sp. CBS 109695]
MPPSHIAILGGGLTGLSSAYHLARKFPRSLITVLETRTRFGGWVRSERVQITDERLGGATASVVLEAGPRTLRPNGKSVLELIHLLGLEDSLVLTPKTAAAARNRFLYVPGSATGLDLIPTTLPALFSSPLSRILLPAVLREPLRRANRPEGLLDESVDAFMARRFGKEFARVFGSAMVHGIYAADSRELSVKAAFPTVWRAEERGGGSVVRGFLRKSESGVAKHDYDMGDMAKTMEDVAVYSFKDGIQTITDALVRDLRKNPNVQLQSGVGVTALRLNPLHKRLEVTTSRDPDPIHPSHVVSTLSLPDLHAIIPPSLALPHLRANAYSTVTVVNLVFPPPPPGAPPLHPAGFGYLVPRPETGYSSRTPGILGTVFDSAALAPQDAAPAGLAKLTKLTVMLGGPHPLTPAHTAPRALLAQLAAHLGHALPAPLAVRVHRHVACIPTLGVGHVERMGELRAALGAAWAGRLEVVGAGVGGVSVGDCVEAGKRVGDAWV